jgi:hypothetical protein
METLLSPAEVRVLGCLIEKQIAVPESYPLTLNTLTHACNQTTNREPVMSLSETAVEAALDDLAEKGLVWKVLGSRAPKYEHRFKQKFPIPAGENAVMCLLMLRGPQTAGELRSRSGRLHEFASLEEVAAAIESLTRAEPPLAIKLPRVPGTKEYRFGHLLGIVMADSLGAASGQAEPATGEARAEVDRSSGLEAEVAELRRELQELRQQFLELKKQFE